MNDYGPGMRGELIVDRGGPTDPPQLLVDEAWVMLNGTGRGGAPPLCMDCVPNLILKDYFCDEPSQGWEWGRVIAHDNTCPTYSGLVAAATPLAE